MSENLQVAVDHDRYAGALIDMDHRSDYEIVLHHALGALAKIGSDIACDIGHHLVFDLACSRGGQSSDQRNKRGRAEALRKAGVDKTGCAGPSQLVPAEGADLYGLVIGQDNPCLLYTSRCV